MSKIYMSYYTKSFIHVDTIHRVVNCIPYTGSGCFKEPDEGQLGWRTFPIPLLKKSIMNVLNFYLSRK